MNKAVASSVEIAHNYEMGNVGNNYCLENRCTELSLRAAWLCLPLLLGCHAPQPIPQPLFIHLTGTEHQWHAEYLGSNGDRILVGPDLHVPVGYPVVFVLQSTDYIYTMAIPEFGLKEIAVPELEFRMSLRPMRSGVFPLIGEELCGLPGEDGPGRLIVEPLSEFQPWFDRHCELAKHSKLALSRQ